MADERTDDEILQAYFAPLEDAIGDKLPADFLNYHVVVRPEAQQDRVRDLGDPSMGDMVIETGACSTVEDIVEQRRRLCDMFEDELQQQTGDDILHSGPVKLVGWSKGWVPIFPNDGREFICLDLDPGPEGTWGQVISTSTDDPGGIVMADSFADLVG